MFPTNRPSLGRILKDRRGATAIEYGLILALVVLAIMASVAGVADATIGMWDGVRGAVSRVMG
ncbi:Flp family type IVb pilin [Stakelama saccharophila]|uniref:Flp family type IVb pilin n=1 Tax=Stakelama saccharophila TaxID=3075605 RepID=A0ABZ0B6A7_9SPHN|nr:Flp family type IVb pilin [Stakelama sp. W311]WNO52666.1 Flp family type IVb pilin [Stakelama sp. W311]